jgi:hypothetical protein
VLPISTATCRQWHRSNKLLLNFSTRLDAIFLLHFFPFLSLHFIQRSNSFANAVWPLSSSQADNG